jgi:hypothetical protein
MLKCVKGLIDNINQRRLISVWKSDEDTFLSYEKIVVVLWKSPFFS